MYVVALIPIKVVKIKTANLHEISIPLWVTNVNTFVTQHSGDMHEDVQAETSFDRVHAVWWTRPRRGIAGC